MLDHQKFRQKVKILVVSVEILFVHFVAFRAGDKLTNLLWNQKTTLVPINFFSDFRPISVQQLVKMVNFGEL